MRLLVSKKIKGMDGRMEALFVLCGFDNMYAYGIEAMLTVLSK